VELADAALREVEDEPDLPHGELLEVIEEDDQALLEGELLRHHLHDVLPLELVDRALGAAVLEAVAEVLSSLGAEIVEVELPFYGEAMAALLAICGAEMFAYHAPDARARLGDYFAGNQRSLASAAFCSGPDYVQAQRFRRVAHKAADALFDDVDLVLTPTTATGAIAHDVLGPFLGDWFHLIHTAYWDLTGNPVISMPAGFTGGGLPLGVQLAGRPFEETAVLAAAHAYQSKTDWHLAAAPTLTAAA